MYYYILSYWEKIEKFIIENKLHKSNTLFFYLNKKKLLRRVECLLPFIWPLFLFKSSIDFGFVVGEYLIKTGRNDAGRIVLYNNVIHLSEPQIGSILALKVYPV